MELTRKHCPVVPFSCADLVQLLCILQQQKLNSKNTHFQKSILTQEGFSSNLMVSSTALQLDKSYSKIDLSLLQCQSTSQKKHGRLRTTTHFPASVYWVPLIGPGDRRLCMRLALHVHYRPFIGSNRPGMSGTDLDLLTLSLASCVLDSPAICPGCWSSIVYRHRLR